MQLRIIMHQCHCIVATVGEKEWPSSTDTRLATQKTDARVEQYFSQQYIQRFMTSMCQRLHVVINAQGDHTRY